MYMYIERSVDYNDTTHILHGMGFEMGFEEKACILKQGQRNVFITGEAKLDPEEYAIKCVGGQ